MMLVGQNVEQDYGRLISWDDDDDAFDMMSRGVGIQPGEGLVVMEIQQRKLQFLLKCAQIILQDLPLKHPLAQGQSVPGDMPSNVETSEWPSLSMEVEEAPYRVPDKFDIERLRNFVCAKRNHAEDHIWSLREDPSYFHDVVTEWSEHRQERLLTADGRSHPVLRQDVFWDRVLSNMVVAAYVEFLTWDGLSKEVDNLVRLRARHAAEVQLDRELPEDFAQALSHFSHYVGQATKGKCTFLVLKYFFTT